MHFAPRQFKQLISQQSEKITSYLYNLQREYQYIANKWGWQRDSRSIDASKGWIIILQMLPSTGLT